jgi:E3 ubiquitin-protein ligase TRIP12
MEDAVDTEGEAGAADAGDNRRDRSDDAMHHGHFDDEDDEDVGDPFGGFPSTFAALRALTRAYSGQHAQFQSQLEKLKSDDPSDKLVALQTLCETLLMANEDTLAGNFSSDQFVKELVPLLDREEDNPEMMLLACRCLTNLMEALPAATANVVYGGAIPALCSKLVNISFIDLAEQCLSVSLF